VLPELCVSGYLFADIDEARTCAEPLEGATVEAWRTLAALHELTIVGGICEQGEDGAFHNTTACSPRAACSPPTARATYGTASRRSSPRGRNRHRSWTRRTVDWAQASVLVDPDGRVLAGPLEGVGVLVAELAPERARQVAGRTQRRAADRRPELYCQPVEMAGHSHAITPTNKETVP
jgi:predicted amidohydrolase